MASYTNWQDIAGNTEAPQAALQRDEGQALVPDLLCIHSVVQLKRSRVPTWIQSSSARRQSYVENNMLQRQVSYVDPLLKKSKWTHVCFGPQLTAVCRTRSRFLPTTPPSKFLY
ncbi:hypothetical protein NDU88_008572 [Pleurodeles waltl]|uniref:Uncharacterized protein n=1 Tax=Pleurodeles waltl TaxID=8319 RepID=A0AAV7NWL9_PLEWA|nr:hypothetical protein NDU88_008572 [Pleurodeles waltl]